MFFRTVAHFIQNSDRVIASSRPRTRRVRTRFAVVSFSSSHLFAVAVAEIDARLSRSRSRRVVGQTEYRRAVGSTGSMFPDEGRFRFLLVLSDALRISEILECREVHEPAFLHAVVNLLECHPPPPILRQDRFELVIQRRHSPPTFLRTFLPVRDVLRPLALQALQLGTVGLRQRVRLREPLVLRGISLPAFLPAVLPAFLPAYLP